MNVLRRLIFILLVWTCDGVCQNLDSVIINFEKQHISHRKYKIWKGELLTTYTTPPSDSTWGKFDEYPSKAKFTGYFGQGKKVEGLILAGYRFSGELIYYRSDGTIARKENYNCSDAVDVWSPSESSFKSGVWKYYRKNGLIRKTVTYRYIRINERFRIDIIHEYYSRGGNFVFLRYKNRIRFHR